LIIIIYKYWINLYEFKKIKLSIAFFYILIKVSL